MEQETAFSQEQLELLRASLVLFRQEFEALREQLLNEVQELKESVSKDSGTELPKNSKDSGTELPKKLKDSEDLPKKLPDLPIFQSKKDCIDSVIPTPASINRMMDSNVVAHKLVAFAGQLGYTVPEDPHEQYTFVFDWIDEEDPSKGKQAEIFQISTGFEYPGMAIASRQVMQWICDTLNRHFPYK